MTFTVETQASIREEMGLGRDVPVDRRVFTSIPPIDAFTGGFSASQVTFIDSSDRFLFDLTHSLCVNAVSSTGEEVVWIDGGNSVNPYAMVCLCKRFGLEVNEVLGRVNIARAFTAYQMTSLVVERLEEQVKETGCGTVIISCFPDLFLDRDIWWSESLHMMRGCLSTIRNLVGRQGLVMLLTNYGLTKIVHKRALRTMMYDLDRVMRIENRRGGLQISMVDEGRGMMYRPAPYYQMTLEEFMR